MSVDKLYEELNSNEKQQFANICRKLLKTTFIVMQKESERKDYIFCRNNEELFESYFSMTGYHISVDKNCGVVRLHSEKDSDTFISTRMKLSIQESIVLCCLWLIYYEKMSQNRLNKSIVVDKRELDFKIEKFNYRNAIDKTTITRIFSKLSRHNLIELVGKVGQENLQIVIYPSMQFCLSEDDFKDFVERTVNEMESKIKTANKQKDAIEEDDNDDE